MRGYVLGMIPARERTSVTEAELNQMKQITYEAMKAGAFGISADKNLEDRPEDGSWLPSHVASEEEYLALAEVLGQFGVGHIGWTIRLSLTTAPSRGRCWPIWCGSVAVPSTLRWETMKGMNG